jgi:tRNA_anti-like
MLKRTAILTLAASAAFAQVIAPTNIGEAEAQRIEEKIATVRRDSLGKYDLLLGDLQNQFQKAADLDGALAVRAERKRLQTEQSLSEKNYVNEPKSLRSLQETTLKRMQDLISGTVAEAVPKLVEYKKQLTVEGKLDDAVAVRQAIERLQNANVPIIRTDAGAIVVAETLLQAYSADRTRADKTYKGVRFVVRGINGGYRIDPNDAKSLQVFIGGQGTTGWVQCAFNLAQWRYREDKINAVSYLVLIGKDGSETRLGKGLQVDILGDCHGWDELVKMTKCDVSR